MTRAASVEPFGQISMELRQVKPYGYTIATEISQSQPLDRQADQLRKIMSLTHATYKVYMDSKLKLLDYERSKTKNNRRPVADLIIPQPSYRSYIYYDEELLRVTISPEILSSTGAIDACGVGVEWNKNIPNPFKGDEQNIFYKTFSKLLGSTLKV